MRIWKLALAVCCIALFAWTSLGRVRALVDQVGYETLAPKQAIVMGAIE